MPREIDGSRDRTARLLTQRLAALPRFRSVPRLCTRVDPGIDDVPEWQIWTHRETNMDQLRIEEELEKMASRSAVMLHVGTGNSGLAKRFAPLVRRILGITIHEEEARLSERLGFYNYSIKVVNKYSASMDGINERFDFIIDNNPSSYACCLFHFSRMLVSYHDLLKDGGTILTAQPGLGWVHSGNDPSWSLEWADWVELGRALRMPTAQVTEFVYAMERDSGSGMVEVEAAGNSSQHENSDQAETVGLQGPADLPTKRSAPAAEAHRVPILAYHSIADDGPPELRPWRITPSAFEEQLRFLQRHGFRSISLDEWAACIAAKSRPSGRPVVITFDDGYADFLTNAAPRLQAAGFGAAVFVVTGRVGAIADWDTTSGPPLKLMSWDDLRFLEARGFTVGSHMTAHRDLTTLTNEEIEHDSREARATLRRELGHDVDIVAFPGGSSDARVCAALARGGYRIGVEIAERCSTLSDDIRCLPRIEILAGDDIAAFARKLELAGAPSPQTDVTMRSCTSQPAGFKLFTTIYNDARLLEHFLEHYSREGVTEFFIAASPGFREAIDRFRQSYNITVIETSDVAEHFIGGAAAVTQMRSRFQGDAEWAVIVDLDEFVEFGGDLPAIVERAERETANVVRAVMWDRFSADGKIVGFEPGSDLRRVYPIRARFIKNVMHGADYKGVLVKGLLESAVAHHTFAGEVVCSQQLDLSHYKWFDGAIDRVKAAYRMLTDAGRPWADEYQQVLEHYARHGRFAWEEFGGEPDPLLAADIDDIVSLAGTIPGWTEGEDAAEIARASLALEGNPVIVELGVFLGRCTVLLAGPRRRRGTGIVHCIDPFDGSGDAFSVPHYRRILDSLGGGLLREHFDANIARAGLSDWVRVYEGRATDVATDWNQPLDLLLLDGDQSPEGARAAYEAWEPHLKPGGILVLRNAALRDYADGHDGHRLLASREVTPDRYDEIRQLADTVIARKKPRPKAAIVQRSAVLSRSRPRVHLYAQCWNDEFMLPYFFRHYDPFVDRYVIFDDGSTDRSRQILAEHPKVELRRFVRSDPDSFVRSERELSNACWKESRGKADWVIVTDLDEHLYHADMRDYLSRCSKAGVTAIPALGFQMIGEEPTGNHELLCDSCVIGAPSASMMKLSIFDPNQIIDINFVEGRHRARPTGDVFAPVRDEVLLLHYKYLGFARTYARQQQLRAGLGPRDLRRNWGGEYAWSEDELRKDWQSWAAQAVNVREMTADTYPIERWWQGWERATAPYGPSSAANGVRQADPLSRAAFDAVTAAHLAAISPALAMIDAAIADRTTRSS